MAPQRSETTGRRAKRWLTLAAGWALVAVGALLLFLPGPGVPLLLAGLALLGREVAWAKRLHGWLSERVGRMLRRGRPASGSAPSPSGT